MLLAIGIIILGLIVVIAGIREIKKTQYAIGYVLCILAIILIFFGGYAVADDIETGTPISTKAFGNLPENQLFIIKVDPLDVKDSTALLVARYDSNSQEIPVYYLIEKKKIDGELKEGDKIINVQGIVKKV